MSKLKIVYDIDDILHGLNKRICNKHNININYIKNYNVKKNTDLTEDEMQTLISGYKNEDTFKNIEWYPGIERLLNVEKLSTDNVQVEVWINSNSFTHNIANLKREQILKKIPISENRLILSIIGEEDTDVEKLIGEDTYILVDDNPGTLNKSSATINITMNNPWDTSKEFYTTVNKVVEVHDSLDSIITTVEHYISKEVKRLEGERA